MKDGSSTKRITATRYLEMAECGIFAPDDRTELLDGLIVSMAPPTPQHDSAVHRVQMALFRKLGLDVIVRVQSSFLVGDESVPQPDIAVVPGPESAYYEAHPSTAELVVEVSHSSVIQDRITKAAIYAQAGVPCYWIVNLRDKCVEVFSDPDRTSGEYRSSYRAQGADRLDIDAWPELGFEARELLLPTYN